jgi:tetratricopeptide (TPR) repeat protein
VLPALLCLVIGVGALREFAGDLMLAAGQRQFALGKLDTAGSSLARGMELCRWPGEYPLYLGLVQIAGNQPAKARSNLEKSLAENPTFEGYLALAELSIDLGWFEEADKHLSLVEDCEPYQELRFQAAYLRALSDLRQDRHEKAYHGLRALVEADPDNQRAWLALGYLAVLVDDQEQARKCYSRALAIIDGKIRDLETERGTPRRGDLVRLRDHRKTAQKALNSIEQ